MFNQSQEAVNQRVDSLITSMGQHSTVEVVINGVKHGKTTSELIFQVISGQQVNRMADLLTMVNLWQLFFL